MKYVSVLTMVTSSILFSMSESLTFSFFMLILFFASVCHLLYIFCRNSWGVSLFYIVVASGLFVVFFYMVNCTSELPQDGKLDMGVMCMLPLLAVSMVAEIKMSNWLYMYMPYTSLTNTFKEYGFLAFFMLWGLLVLIVLFMRLTYSKSGSVRMKY
uniref:NADH dehydrogenase subunit 6 n=1 Tax=Amyrsidea minuta TaxID=2364307 RepID=A0A386B2N6_9NEOP|nr:NADH dehydrogenase subunit 6 [Amyrsidea minuta]